MGYPCPENLGVAPQKKGHGGCSPKSHFFVVSSLQSFFCSLQRQRTMPKSSLQSTQRDSCKVLRKIAKIQFHTTRGGGINHVFSPLITCSPKSRFPHLFLHVRKIHAYSHFLLRKKLRNLHLFCETPSVFPLLLHVCQNHAYSHLLLHVRRNHVYSLHTQSIKEFLRLCEKSRKFNFTPHGAGV